ncbi:hypothetical protein SMICM304S_04221 [Streptomyces microflavus]
MLRVRAGWGWWTARPLGGTPGLWHATARSGARLGTLLVSRRWACGVTGML